MHNTQRARNRWLSNVALNLKTRMTLSGEFREGVSSLQNDLTARLGENAKPVVSHLDKFMEALDRAETGPYKFYLRAVQAELQKHFAEDLHGIAQIQEVLALQARRLLHLREAHQAHRIETSRPVPHVYH